MPGYGESSGKSNKKDLDGGIRRGPNSHTRSVVERKIEVTQTSVSAVGPVSTTAVDAARELRELAGLVYAYGMCRSYVFDPYGEDPWFPTGGRPEELEERAVKACAGCPVIAECLEMALRLEAGLPRDNVVGIFGATPGHQRRRMLDVRRGGGVS
jgi:hypothetical protein